MGIPRYVGFLKRRQYPGVIVAGLPAISSTLSIDMNSLFHAAAQEVYAYGDDYKDPVRWAELEEADPQKLEVELFENIGVRLLNAITTVSPTDALILCVDGLAPFAKMQQQRQRRYKSKVKTREELEKAKIAGGSAPKIFDSNSITPGTEFMQRLDAFLQQWILNNRKNVNSKLPPMVRYSSYLETGEGEHKIFDMIRRSLDPDTPADDPAKAVYDPRKIHIIYGLDADLIMLSTMCPLDRVHLMREDVQDVVNIGNLRRAIKYDLKTETAIPDFIIMMYLLGNDFLPHHPGFEDLDTSVDQLFEVYRAVNLPLTQGDNILFDNLNVFLDKLVEIEPALIEQVSKLAVKYPSRMINASLDPEGKFIFARFRSAWYLNELGMKGKPDLVNQVWEKFGLSPELRGISPDEIVKMCESYLTGLAWVFRYYNRGPLQVSDKFIYPFFHCPLITDLNEVLKQIKVDTSQILPELGWETLIPHQLLIVIPPQSVNLIPKELRVLYDVDSPIADIFPINFVIEKDGKNDVFQFLPLVPPVDIYRVITAVDSLRLDLNVLLKYAERKTLQLNAVEGGTRYNEQRQLRAKINQIAYGSESGRSTQRARGTQRGRGTSRGRGRGRGEGRGRGQTQERGRGRSERGESRFRGEGRARGEGTRGRSERGRGRPDRSRERPSRSRGRGIPRGGAEIVRVERNIERPQREESRGERPPKREPKPDWGSLQPLL